MVQGLDELVAKTQEAFETEEARARAATSVAAEQRIHRHTLVNIEHLVLVMQKASKNTKPSDAEERAIAILKDLNEKLSQNKENLSAEDNKKLADLIRPLSEQVDKIQSKDIELGKLAMSCLKINSAFTEFAQRGTLTPQARSGLINDIKSAKLLSFLNKFVDESKDPEYTLPINNKNKDNSKFIGRCAIEEMREACRAIGEDVLKAFEESGKEPTQVSISPEVKKSQASVSPLTIREGVVAAQKMMVS